MITSFIIRHRAEFRRLVRFGIIGLGCFALYAGVYALLSRRLWVSGNRTFENFLAVVLASIVNFYAHRWWTFEAKGNHLTHVARYLVVAATATGLQSLLFWFGQGVLRIYDFAVAVGVTGLIAFYTYFMHRFYTFREEGRGRVL